MTNTDNASTKILDSPEPADHMHKIKQVLNWLLERDIAKTLSLFIDKSTLEKCFEVDRDVARSRQLER
jgi:hypothetical protein